MLEKDFTEKEMEMVEKTMCKKFYFFKTNFYYRLNGGFTWYFLSEKVGKEFEDQSNDLQEISPEDKKELKEGRRGKKSAPKPSENEINNNNQ